MHNDSHSPQQFFFDTLTTLIQANTDPVLRGAAATTYQKLEPKPDPKSHLKPSTKEKALNFKDDGPLIVAKDKLDDAIFPSPTTPHRSLSLFPAIPAPTAIGEELVLESPLQPGEIRVPSRWPTPLPDKWCDLCL